MKKEMPAEDVVVKPGQFVEQPSDEEICTRFDMTEEEFLKLTPMEQKQLSEVVINQNLQIEDEKRMYKNWGMTFDRDNMWLPIEYQINQYQLYKKGQLDYQMRNMKLRKNLNLQPFIMSIIAILVLMVFITYQLIS